MERRLNPYMLDEVAKKISIRFRKNKWIWIWNDKVGVPNQKDIKVIIQNLFKKIRGNVFSISQGKIRLFDLKGTNILIILNNTCVGFIDAQ